MSNMSLKVGDKTYQVKYSIAATLCEECVERVTDLMMRFETLDSQNGDVQESLQQFFHSFSAIAPTTLAMLYAGLMQYHGRRGDKTVMSKDDAEDLLIQYIEENKDNEDGNMYSLMEKLMNQMGEDDFFKQIGLDKIGAKVTEAVSEAENKPKRGGRKSTVS